MDIKPYSKNAKKHPEKQLEQIKNSILAFGFRQPIVLDLFGGSGSTLIAAQNLERKCYIMEFDPKYAQVIIERYEKKTKQLAEKL